MKCTLALVVSVLVAVPAFAQYVYLLPPSDPNEPLVVAFSVSPTPDVKIGVEALRLDQLTAVAADGSTSQVKAGATDKGTLAARTGGAVAVYGTTDFGVANRGQGHEFLIRYHAKMDRDAKSKRTVGLPVEIVAKVSGDGVAFVVTADGKPVGAADVTVHEPDGGKVTVVKTDTQGVTPSFTKPGRYAARVSHFEKKAGDHEGRRYAGVHHYSTLVTTFDGR